MQSTVRVGHRSEPIRRRDRGSFAGGPTSDALELRRGVRIPLAEIELRTSRSSGPAASTRTSPPRASRRSSTWPRRARSATAIARCLLERLGPRVTAVAQDARSQLRNRELALERLRAKLDEALVVRAPAPRRRAPTRGRRASGAWPTKRAGRRAQGGAAPRRAQDED